MVTVRGAEGAGTWLAQASIVHRQTMAWGDDGGRRASLPLSTFSGRVIEKEAREMVFPAEGKGAGGPPARGVGEGRAPSAPALSALDADVASVIVESIEIECAEFAGADPSPASGERAAAERAVPFASAPVESPPAPAPPAPAHRPSSAPRRRATTAVDLSEREGRPLQVSVARSPRPIRGPQSNLPILPRVVRSTFWGALSGRLAALITGRPSRWGMALVAVVLLGAVSAIAAHSGKPAATSRAVAPALIAPSPIGAPSHGAESAVAPSVGVAETSAATPDRGPVQEPAPSTKLRESAASEATRADGPPGGPAALVAQGKPVTAAKKPAPTPEKHPTNPKKTKVPPPHHTSSHKRSTRN
jgi:hypothetical protein